MLDPFTLYNVPRCVLLSVIGKLAAGVAPRAACVQREWTVLVTEAKMLGMYDVKLRFVSMGCHTTVACCTEEGHLFTFGEGPALGHGQLENAHESRLRRVEALSEERVIGVAYGMADPAEENVRLAAAWTDKGDLFTFGCGDYGQLGHGSLHHRPVPTLVQALAGNKVVGVAVGAYHMAAWTDAGGLFTFGREKDGRLGHGSLRGQAKPRMVQALAGKKAIGASAGMSCTAVWTDAGELFTFGRGERGILGHGEHQLLPVVSVPTPVEALVGKKVVGAAAGEEHMAVWIDAGELFTSGWGWGLGHEWHGGRNKPPKEYAPRRVEALAGKKTVIGATVGFHHTAVWTDTGELITFGRGIRRWASEDDDAPRLFEALAEKKVIGAAAAAQHMAVWTDTGEILTLGRREPTPRRVEWS